jgi:hypothetical protein
VSKDAIIAAVVLGNDEIHVYRVNSSSFLFNFFSFMTPRENFWARKKPWFRSTSSK